MTNNEIAFTIVDTLVKIYDNFNEKLTARDLIEIETYDMLDIKIRFIEDNYQSKTIDKKNLNKQNSYISTLMDIYRHFKHNEIAFSLIHKELCINADRLLEESYDRNKFFKLISSKSDIIQENELPPPSDEELPPEEYKEVEELIYSDTQYKELEETNKFLLENGGNKSLEIEKLNLKLKKSKELAYQLIEDNADLKKEIFEIKINNGE